MQRLRLKAPASVVADYFHLFVNRRAYTLQSNRPHPQSARHYYYRPKDNKTGQGLSLTTDTIRRHLEGEITIGLYSINPATQSSKWVAIDADYEDALTDLLKLSFYLRQDGVESALEKSHRGGHLWIFLAEPLPARDCRTCVCDLGLRLGIPVKGGKQLARLIAGKAIPPQLLSPEPKAEPEMKRHVCGPEFRILEHINTKLRTVGHNNVTRCPSCGEEGRDRSGDNLSISIEDPHKYICWAGCTRDMIRAAVGCPRPVQHALHGQKEEASNVEIRRDSDGLARA
jgi:hypothetical protein